MTFRRTALAPALLLVLAGTSACGNAVTAEVTGRAGITLDAQGRVVLVIAPCGADIDRVTIVGDRTGLADDEPNPQVGAWTTSTAQDATFELVISAPDSVWSGAAVPALPGDGTFIASAEESGADVEVVPVSFSTASLAGIDEDHLLVGDRMSWTRERFEDEACD